VFRVWFREHWLIIRGYNRDFYCQREEEGDVKCKIECEHCNIYYQPLVDSKKLIND